jgi:ribosomal protein S12 methylthiotransferase
MSVLVDAVGADGAIARSAADAPEIDGVVHIAPHPSLQQGEFVRVGIVSADAHDLHATIN